MHTINYDEIKKHEVRYHLAGSAGGKVKKDLYCCVDMPNNEVTYEVKVNGLNYYYAFLKESIDFYNIIED